MERFINEISNNPYMQSFEELLRQDTLAYCVSGHGFDSGMAFEDMLQFYKGRNLREEPNARFMGQREGSKFFLGDLAVMYVYAPPDGWRVEQAQQLGIEGLKSHVDIHPGERYYQGIANSLDAPRQELRQLIRHHVEQKIPATCYFLDKREFQGINKV